MPRLAGRVAIVTGAAEGVGRSVALGLATEGAAVILADHREGRLSELHLELGRRNFQSMAVPTKATDEPSVHRLIQQVLSSFDRIDILINGVSLNAHAGVEETTEAIWDEIAQANLVSAFLCAKAAVPAMLKQGFGRIISFTSAEAFRGSRDAAPYAAAKAGIIGFSKALALELAHHGITVNTICAGEDCDALALNDASACVGLAIFLASDAAAYVTGQTLFASDVGNG